MMQSVPETQVYHIQVPAGAVQPSLHVPVVVQGAVHPPRPGGGRTHTWAVVVLIFSILLGLYGLYLELVAFAQMELIHKKRHNFGLWTMIVNGLFCVLSGIYGLRAGILRTLASAQEYLRMISLNAAVFIALNGISIIVAIANDDCEDASAEAGWEANCSTRPSRIVILIFSLFILSIVMCCCGACLWCAKSLVNAVLYDTYGDSMPQQMETYSSNNGAVYTSVPNATPAQYAYAAQPAAAVSAFPVYTSTEVHQYPEKDNSCAVDGSV